MTRRDRQSGVAVLIAMLVVTVGTIIAVNLMWQGTLDLRRAEAALAADQGMLYVQGAEAFHGLAGRVIDVRVVGDLARDDLHHVDASREGIGDRAEHVGRDRLAVRVFAVTQDTVVFYGYNISGRVAGLMQH